MLLCHSESSIESFPPVCVRHYTQTVTQGQPTELDGLKVLETSPFFPAPGNSSGSLLSLFLFPLAWCFLESFQTLSQYHTLFWRQSWLYLHFHGPTLRLLMVFFFLLQMVPRWITLRRNYPTLFTLKENKINICWFEPRRHTY